MAPRTSGSSLGRSFVQAEKKLDEEEKEMAYNEKMEEEEEGKNTLQHTLEAMSLNKSQVNISPPITYNDAISPFQTSISAGELGQLQAATRVDCEKSKEFSGEGGGGERGEAGEDPERRAGVGRQL